MKRIIVFGATGGSGRETVKQALEQGHKVTAVARDPAAITLTHDQLEVVKADVMNESLKKIIHGHDVVISCLGTTSLKPTTVYSTGTGNIINAMQENDVSRLICISSAALEITKEMGFLIRLLTRLVLQRILRNLYADMRVMEEQVQATDLNWTIVRPARLINKPLSRNYRVAIDSPMKKPWSIARADLAHLLLNSIDDRNMFHSKIEIAY